MKKEIKNKSSLRLQSYKLDSQNLAEKIKELNNLKLELQSTLTKKRTEEESILDQLTVIKSENNRLKQEILTLQFTNKTQESLIQKLENRLQKIANKQAYYLQQIQNKSKQKSQLQDHYQQKISFLMNSQTIMRESFRKELQQLTKNLNKELQLQNQSNNSAMSSSAKLDEKKDSKKVIKRLKKSFIVQPELRRRNSISVEEKYRSNNMILQRQQDSFLSGEDIYLQAIRQLYRQLTKIGIKANDMLKIPPIYQFDQITEANRLDFCQLFTKHPFQLKQTAKIYLVYDYFFNQCQRTKNALSGNYVIRQIIQAIQEIQNNSIFSCSKIDINNSLQLKMKQNQYYSACGSSKTKIKKENKFKRDSRSRSDKISIDASLGSENSLYF